MLSYEEARKARSANFRKMLELYIDDWAKKTPEKFISTHGDLTSKQLVIDSFSSPLDWDESVLREACKIHEQELLNKGWPVARVEHRRFTLEWSGVARHSIVIVLR